MKPSDRQVIFAISTGRRWLVAAPRKQVTSLGAHRGEAWEVLLGEEFMMTGAVATGAVAGTTVPVSGRLSSAAAAGDDFPGFRERAIAVASLEDARGRRGLVEFRMRRERLAMRETKKRKKHAQRLAVST